MRFVGKRPLCEGGWFSDVQLCDSNMQLCDCPVFYSRVIAYYNSYTSKKNVNGDFIIWKAS